MTRAGVQYAGWGPEKGEQKKRSGWKPVKTQQWIMRLRWDKTSRQREGSREEQKHLKAEWLVRTEHLTWENTLTSTYGIFSKAHGYKLDYRLLLLPESLSLSLIRVPCFFLLFLQESNRFFFSLTHLAATSGPVDPPHPPNRVFGSFLTWPFYHIRL